MRKGRISRLGTTCGTAPAIDRFQEERLRSAPGQAPRVGRVGKKRLFNREVAFAQSDQAVRI